MAGINLAKVLINTSTQVLSKTDECNILLEKYSSILEKTNGQLNAWISISNLAIAILSAIIALIAIFVGVVLYKNSDEQKKLFIRTVEEQKGILKDRYEIAQKEYDDLIAKKKKEIGTANKEGKEKIEDIIRELEREKARIGLDARQVGPTGPIGFTAINGRWDTFGQVKEIFCVKCGKKFNYPIDRNYLVHHVYPMQDFTFCPYCGAINNTTG